MKDFIAFLLNQIIQNPEAMEITQEDDGGLQTYKIKVAQEDMGLVIGKAGKTIRSIRSLVRAKAIKDGVRIKVELVETDGNN